MVAILKAPVAFHYQWCRLFIQLSCSDAPWRIPAIRGTVRSRRPLGNSTSSQVAGAHAVLLSADVLSWQLSYQDSGVHVNFCPSLLLASEVTSQKSAGKPVRTRSLPPVVTVNPPPSLSPSPSFLRSLGHRRETPGSLGSRVKTQSREFPCSCLSSKSLSSCLNGFWKVEKQP